MGESTALQDAMALLTLSFERERSDELDDLVAEFLADRRPEELVAALVSLARALCFVTARMARAVDDLLSDDETLELTEDDVLPAAIEVVRTFARRAARDAAEETGPPRGPADA